MRFVDGYDRWASFGKTDRTYSIERAVAENINFDQQLDASIYGLAEMFVRLLEQMPEDVILNVLGERWRKAE